MGEILDALQKAERESPKQKPLPQASNPELPDDPRDPLPKQDVPRVQISRSENDDTRFAREVLLNPSSMAAEAYRKFALKVRAELGDRTGKHSIVITAPLRGNGKTTTACNLALALGMLSRDKRIALVDLDLRRPNVGSSMGVTPTVGLETVLARECALIDACIPTDLENLDLYLPAKPQENPLPLIAGSGLDSLGREAASLYDIIIIDTPPVLIVPDAVMITENAASCLMVVRYGETKKKSFIDALAALPGHRLIGTFMNGCPMPPHRRKYGYYYEDLEEKE